MRWHWETVACLSRVPHPSLCRAHPTKIFGDDLRLPLPRGASFFVTPFLVSKRAVMCPQEGAPDMDVDADPNVEDGEEGGGPGALSEKEGRCFMMLLDMAHFLVDDITGEFNFPDLGAATQLRVSQNHLAARLTAQMYSYWQSAPMGDGVYQMLLDWTQQQQPAGPGVPFECSKELHKIAKEETLHWHKQRVYGYFYFVAEDEEGAAFLVSEDRSKVYRVFGIAVSLGVLLRRGGGALPVRLRLTLLPFMGKIVYDGSLAVSAIPGGPEVVTHARQVMDAAVAAGTVMEALPVPPETPLEGKAVVIAGLTGRPELNGTRAVATKFDHATGRYAVRLPSGAHVALKPTNLSAAPAPAGEAKGEPLSAFQRGVQEQLAALPYAPGDLGALWVFRRHGYTEEHNPEHLLTIMSGGMMPVMACPDSMAMRTEHLTPTVDEILRGLQFGATHAGPMPGVGRSKPRNMGVDEKSILDRLEEVLGPAGIQVGYYPPPSPEELSALGVPPSHPGLF